jgi:hypothetical protein
MPLLCHFCNQILVKDTSPPESVIDHRLREAVTYIVVPELRSLVAWAGTILTVFDTDLSPVRVSYHANTRSPDLRASR